MLNRMLLSGVALTALAGVSLAQTQPGAPAEPAASERPATTAPAAGDANRSETRNEDKAALFSSYEGADIVGANDETVGRLADILVDSGGEIKQLVIGHGGVLGVGETLRRHEAASLPRLVDEELKLELTTAAVQALPEFAYPGEDAAEGRASADRAGTSGLAAGPSSGTASGTATGTAAPSAAPIGAGAQFWPLSYLVGAEIENVEENAEVDDIRFGQNRIEAVILKKGGVLGLGAEEREIAWSDLEISGEPTDPEIMLKADAAQKAGVELKTEDRGGSTAPAGAARPPQ